MYSQEDNPKPLSKLRKVHFKTAVFILTLLRSNSLKKIIQRLLVIGLNGDSIAKKNQKKEQE